MHIYVKYALIFDFPSSYLTTSIPYLIGKETSHGGASGLLIHSSVCLSLAWFLWLLSVRPLEILGTWLKIISNSATSLVPKLYANVFQHGSHLGEWLSWRLEKCSEMKHWWNLFMSQRAWVLMEHWWNYCHPTLPGAIITSLVTIFSSALRLSWLAWLPRLLGVGFNWV